MRGWGKQLGSSGGWSNCLVSPPGSQGLRQGRQGLGGLGPAQGQADFLLLLNKHITAINTEEDNIPQHSLVPLRQ